MHELISKKLIELRGDKSQKEVAEALGISAMSLSHYENGRRKPSVDMLYRLSRYYNVDMGIFFTDK